MRASVIPGIKPTFGQELVLRAMAGAQYTRYWTGNQDLAECVECGWVTAVPGTSQGSTQLFKLTDEGRAMLEK